MEHRERAETVPCRQCGDPTPWLGTRLCDACWLLRAALRRFAPRRADMALRIMREVEIEGALPAAPTVDDLADCIRNFSGNGNVSPKALAARIIERFWGQP